MKLIGYNLASAKLLFPFSRMKKRSQLEGKLPLEPIYVTELDPHCH